MNFSLNVQQLPIPESHEPELMDLLMGLYVNFQHFISTCPYQPEIIRKCHCVWVFDVAKLDQGPHDRTWPAMLGITVSTKTLRLHIPLLTIKYKNISRFVDWQS